MNLKPRFFLLTSLMVIASALAAWWIARQQAEVIVEQWAVRYAEKQVLYDKSRMMQPILREIALARQLAASPQIREWARKPDDPKLTQRATAEMESFRLNFTDKSYFLALNQSGRYYHNNATNEFAKQPFRYVLDPKKPADQWFYGVIGQQRDMHLNVNPDVHLGVTKLWIDVLIRDGNDVLGVAGTGLDLTQFIHEVVGTTQPGISSLFTDHDGAIQVIRDERMIDFGSITKNAGERKTIDLLFDRRKDREAILSAMKELEQLKTTVVTRFVTMNGKSYLAGVAFLPEIDWYEITLLDLNVVLPLASFSGILLVYGLMLLAALVMFNLVLSRLVLRPLGQLEQAIQKVQDGQFSPESLPTGERNEIGRLMGHFKHMAQTVLHTRNELEDKVKVRTEALEHLTRTDSLTELLNRRGMAERLEAAHSHNQREHSHFGLLLIDVDCFKEINDKHGHGRGDQALRLIAELIRAIIRPYDSAARWGGDEFLVLAMDCDEITLTRLGERIGAAVRETRHLSDQEGQPIALTLSIGATLVGLEDIERALAQADQAMYAAKDAGRNCLRLYQ
ncbi:MAG: diguanylate cyclase [Pseudomonadota bacterium]